MGRHVGGGIRGGNAYEKAHGLPAGSVESRDSRYKAWAKKRAKATAVTTRKVIAKKRAAPDLRVHEAIKYNMAFKPPATMKGAKQVLLPGAAPALAPPPARASREIVDLTREPDVSRQRRGGRYSVYRSRFQACGCAYEDGTPVGAKVLRAKSGRVYYTCGFAKISGSRLSVGGFKRITSEKRFIKFVETQHVAKEPVYFG